MLEIFLASSINISKSVMKILEFDVFGFAERHWIITVCTNMCLNPVCECHPPLVYHHRHWQKYFIYLAKDLAVKATWYHLTSIAYAPTPKPLPSRNFLGYSQYSYNNNALFVYSSCGSSFPNPSPWAVPHVGIMEKIEVVTPDIWRTPTWLALLRLHIRSEAKHRQLMG